MEKLSRWCRGSYIASSSTVLSLLISCINVGHLLQLMSQYWHVIINKCTVPFFCYVVLWVLTNVEYLVSTITVLWLPWWLSSKESPCQWGDLRALGLILGSGRSSGEGNGNPFWYSCLENTMDRGTWRAIVYGVKNELERT